MLDNDSSNWITKAVRYGANSSHRNEELKKKYYRALETIMYFLMIY